MTVRAAINGFGRIGRLSLRALEESGRKDIEIVAINTRSPMDGNVHLFKYDSAHGRFAGDVRVAGDDMLLNGRIIKGTTFADPEQAPWGDLGIDVVLECSGAFKKRDQAMKHIKAGAKKVLISSPAEGEDRTVVFGVNDDTLKASDLIVSNASCTTNALAPVAMVLENTVGIESGFMTTIHAYTGDQRVVDSSHKKDWHRARTAAVSMIPTTTGAAKAVGKVLPVLAGKLDGTSIRVPTQNVSLVDLCFTAKRDTSADEIAQAMISASQGKLKGVLSVYDEPLVSIDFNHDPHSTIFSLKETRVISKRFVRVMSWYDNEWGFSCRMLDVAVAMMKAQ